MGQWIADHGVMILLFLLCSLFGAAITAAICIDPRIWGVVGTVGGFIFCISAIEVAQAIRGVYDSYYRTNNGSKWKAFVASIKNESHKLADK
jgi:hypothetical protein